MAELQKELSVGVDYSPVGDWLTKLIQEPQLDIFELLARRATNTTVSDIILKTNPAIKDEKVKKIVDSFIKSIYENNSPLFLVRGLEHQLSKLGVQYVWFEHYKGSDKKDRMYIGLAEPTPVNQSIRLNQQQEIACVIQRSLYNSKQFTRGVILKELITPNYTQKLVFQGNSMDGAPADIFFFKLPEYVIANSRHNLISEGQFKGEETINWKSYPAEKHNYGVMSCKQFLNNYWLSAISIEKNQKMKKNVWYMSMRKQKLLKTLLIPALGISAIGSIAAVCTSCGNAIHVTSVTLNKTSTTLGVGDVGKLVATVLPETAIDKSVTWSSSDESIATVDANGKVTAIAEGSATITATSVDNPSVQGICEIRVIESFPYVAINAFEDSTLELINNGENNPNLSYSYDDIDWNTYNGELSILAGQTLYLKGNNPEGFSRSDVNYSNFVINGDVSLGGNVMGLLDNGSKPGEQGDITDIPCDWCFCFLFNNSTVITSVSEDFLPATTLTEACYHSMFHNCTSLTIAPNLFASTLAKNCYTYMFNRCSSLNSIKIGYTGNYDSTYFYGWVYGVASSGTFYYNGSDTAVDFGLNDWTKVHF